MRSLIFVILTVALGLAHLLHDHLLGRLGGDAAEVERGQGVGDGVAHLRRRIVAPGAVQSDLGGRVLHLVHHQQVAGQTQLAGLGVDVGVDVRLLAVARARGLGDGIFHGGNHDAAVDGLFPRDRIGDLQQFQPVCADGNHQCVSFTVLALAEEAAVSRPAFFLALDFLGEAFLPLALRPTTLLPPSLREGPL